jgi:hypothetical protein
MNLQHDNFEDGSVPPADASADPTASAWDQAVSNRLAKLRRIPIDTSALQTRLHQEMRWQESPLRLWIRPLRVAAGLLVTATLALAVLWMLNHPTVASASELAKMHQDLVAGRTPAVEVSSIDEANKVLLATASTGPSFPAIPVSHLHSCCVANNAERQIACVLLKSDDVYVTMAIAASDKIRMPPGQEVVRNGITFHTQTTDGVNMVTFERGGRHVCLMSELPTDKLIELGTMLEF